MLTLLKQRKISCILKVESLQRGIRKDQEVTEGMTDMADVEKELEEVERKMSELEKEREDRSKRIMDRRVLQVTTLQELGLLEAAGKDSKWRSESDLKDRDQSQESPSPSLIARYSPGAASSSSSHASRKCTPPPGLLEARLRAGSDPSIGRPDPSGRLQPDSERNHSGSHSKGLVAKLSPRLGRRNPLRMLSNAIDFRTRRKQRPKSADFENTEDTNSETRSQSSGTNNNGSGSGSSTARSASVTDILECVSLSPGPQQNESGGANLPPAPRVLEGRNSAPDMLGEANNGASTLGNRNNRNRTRLSAAATAKQKLSTRFQPQRKAQHRLMTQQQQISSVKRAKTFSLGGPGPGNIPTNYKTLPKQSSSRSIGSTSTDSSQSSQSTASSRKSSNSSNISDCSMNSVAITEISQSALEEIAAFEKFITEYFENSDNNNTNRKPSQQPVAGSGRPKQKVSASSILSEVLELSI